MNRDDLVPRVVPTFSSDKKLLAVASQNGCDGGSSGPVVGPFSTGATVETSPSMSVQQQIKDILVQDPRKASALLQVISPSNVQNTDHGIEIVSDIRNIVSMNSISSCRVIPTKTDYFHENRRSTSLSIREDYGDSPLSDLHPTITSVNLMDTGTETLSRAVRTNSNSTYITSSRAANSSKNSVSLSSTNKILTKIFQSPKMDVPSSLQLKNADFPKVPVTSLRSSVQKSGVSNHISDKPLTDLHGSSPFTTISPPNHDLSRIHLVSSVGTENFNRVSASPTSSSTYQNVSLNRQTSPSVLQPSSHSLDDFTFTDPFPIMSGGQKIQNKHISSNHISDLDIGKTNYTNPKSLKIPSNTTNSTNLLISGTPLLSDNSLSTDVELNFISDPHILSQIQMTEISSKENGQMQPDDMFITGLQPADHDLLRASLSTSITSPVPVSDVSNSSNNLPELPPSPILETITPDLLVGSGSSASKVPLTGHAPNFLSNLSNTTENLALTFSTNFLDNSNMSIDIGSLSEGEVFGGESVDSNASLKRSSGNELNFSVALRNATEKNANDQTKSGRHTPSISSCSRQSISDSSESNQISSSASYDVFKSPMSKSNQSNDAHMLSPSGSGLKRQCYSAKEFRIDASPPPKMSPSPVDSTASQTSLCPSKPESLVQEVSCFKCQLCSYLSLEKEDMNDHVKNKHKDKFLPTPSTSNVSSTVASLLSDIKPLVSSIQTVEAVKDSQKSKQSPKAARKTKAKATKKKVSKSSSKVKREIKTRTPSPVLQDDPFPPTTDTVIHVRSISSSFVHSPQGTFTTVQNPMPFNDFIKKHSGDQIFASSSSESSIEVIPIIKPLLKPATNSVDPLSISEGTTVIKSQKAETNLQLERAVDSKIRCGVNGCGLRMKEEANISYHRKCHVGAFLKCPECGNKFSHWSSLAIHLWNHHVIDMELYTCEKCPFKSYSYTKLMNGHWQTHSTERPFVCDVCGKDFKTLKQLRSHKQLLHVGKPEDLKHNCSMCQRKFAEKRMLLLHLEAVHRKVKPYLCNYCGNSFASKSTLNLHIRKHTGERPFSCDLCSYKTSDHNSIRRHRMKHTNERPYACPYCDYSSIQSSTFKVHLRKKHEDQALKDEIIFSCSICSFKTVKKDNYLAHVGTHHVISADQQNTEAQKQKEIIHNQQASKKLKSESNAETKLPSNQILYFPPSQTSQANDNNNNARNKAIVSVIQPNPASNSSTSSTLLNFASTQAALETQSQLLIQSSGVIQPNISFSQDVQEPIKLHMAKVQPRSSADSTVRSQSEVSPAVSTAILVTNPKTTGSGQQQMFYVLGDLLPFGADASLAESGGRGGGLEGGGVVSSDMLGGVIVSNNAASSTLSSVILNGAEGLEFRSGTSDNAFLHALSGSAESMVQLTPEVVALPVTGSGPVSIPTSACPGLIFMNASDAMQGR